TLAFPCFDGIYLPKQENEFVHQVMDELETYQQKSNVLLFPPLPSRLRYLIHKTIEDLPELTTFSVGESWHRRVVVCHSELRYRRRSASTKYSPFPYFAISREETDNLAPPKPSIPSRNRAPKRPDKPIYMPRAARERLSLQNSQGPTANKESSSPSSNSCISSSSNNHSCCHTTNTTESSSTFRQESPPTEADSIPNHTAEGSVHCLQEEKQKLETEPFCRNLYPAVFFVFQIKAHLKEAVSFSIEHVHNDYSVYENVCINPDEFRHVIEIYDFPSMFKTDDLLDAFTDYRCEQNHHDLVCHPNSCTSPGWIYFIQPVKERPRTDCAVARRMVTRALGLRGRGRGRGRVQRY
uniref:R3H domain-containing protein n=1 Tax=Anabas testudineus TaxID=64144 RepID=A0A7N6AER2_ANATE